MHFDKTLLLPFSVSMITTEMSPPLSHSVAFVISENVSITTICWCFYSSSLSDSQCSLFTIEEENNYCFPFIPLSGGASVADMSAHVFVLQTFISVQGLPEKRWHHAPVSPSFPPAFPQLFQHSVDMALSYSCSLVHANPLLVPLLPYISLNILLSACLTSFLSPTFPALSCRLIHP